MPSDIWSDFLNGVRGGFAELAGNTVGDFAAQAQSDVTAFLTASRDNLERWMQALAEDRISHGDFEFLVLGQRDLAALHALTALGLATATLERFRTGLISLVLSSAFNAVGLRTG